MRRRAALFALGAGLLAGAVASQEAAVAQPGAGPAGAPIHAPEGTAGAPPGTADVPAGPAALRGRVVHADEPAPGGVAPGGPSRAAGVEVMLYALPASGAPGVRRVVSDPDGRFAFEGISNDPQTAYLVGARHAGVPFPGTRVVFEAGETERTAEVRIGESTPDPAAVEVAETQIRLETRGGRLVATEVHQLANRGPRTVYVPRDARGGAPPAFSTRLPDGASEAQIPLGIAPEGLVTEGEEVRFFGPIYPSSWPEHAAQEQAIAFHYELAGSAGALELRKELPSGARRAVVLAPEAGPALRVPGARDEGVVDVDGRRMRRFVAEPLARGASLAIAVELPPVRVDRSAVRLEEARVFLELDDAALLVRSELRVRVTGDQPVAAPRGEPLLALPIAEGARDLRFDRAAFDLGLAADGQGGAVLEGPLPPGESAVEVAYHLPVADPRAGTELDLRFGAELPLLSVFVADTGLRLSSERLHRRRPIATTDRTFLHLEAFQVAPDETVRVALAPLAPAPALPRGLLYAGVALAAAGAAAFLAAPLGSAGRTAAAGEEGEDAARHEREAVYAALRDLDHDHETGKVADADYAAMRGELRGRAAALIRQERRAAAEGAVPAIAPPPESTPICVGCGQAGRPGDRFCARCGARLGAPAEPRESGAPA